MDIYNSLNGYKNNYYSLLMDITDEIILFFDENGKIIECNSVAYVKLGYTEDITDIYISDIFNDIFKKNDENRIVISDTEERINSVMYRKNRTCFDVTIRVKKFLQQDGMLIYVLSAHDTTLLKNAEKQLAIAKEDQKMTEQIRNEFVANVTHELRTPLNGIIGHVKDMKDNGLLDSQVKSIEIIEHCADNMMKLINNILDFSKIEAGKYVLDEHEIQFSKFIDNIVATHIKTVDQKGLKLVLNVDVDIPEYVFGDSMALERIVNNLMSNAVKFTSVGHIMLQITKASETDDYVEIFFMVIDSGIGISDEEKTKLFKEFSQVDASVTRKYGGTGLGLAITKHLVEMMNGNIYVESTKGQGSTFSFNVFLKKSAKIGNIDENNYSFSDLGSISRVQGEDIDTENFGNVNKFGTKENLYEIQKNMDKLAITIELHNFEKAEMFASNVKGLVQGQDEELDRFLFKIILTLRKQNYEKSEDLLNTIKIKVADLLKGQQ